PWSTRLVVLFGGMLSGMGWFLFGFGMLFVWIFASRGDYSSAFFMRGPLETAPGVITAVKNTRFSEGGRQSKGTPIYACTYMFNAGGSDYEGTSYRKGEG